MGSTPPVQICSVNSEMLMRNIGHSNCINTSFDEVFIVFRY